MQKRLLTGQARMTESKESVAKLGNEKECWNETFVSGDISEYDYLVDTDSDKIHQNISMKARNDIKKKYAFFCFHGGSYAALDEPKEKKWVKNFVYLWLHVWEGVSSSSIIPSLLLQSSVLKSLWHSEQENIS